MRPYTNPHDQEMAHSQTHAPSHHDPSQGQAPAQAAPGQAGGTPLQAAYHRIGDFDIVREIGRGSMGTVYKARHKSLNRVCALKTMPKHAARDTSFVERFRREARAAAAIDHPSVIEVYDVGQQDGTHYIAMEFVDGEHLGIRLKRDGRVPPRQARIGRLRQLDDRDRIGVIRGGDPRLMVERVREHLAVPRGEAPRAGGAVARRDLELVASHQRDVTSIASP